MKLRKATIDDVPAIYRLIRELAIFEKAGEEVINTPEQLRIDLFDDQVCEAIVCDVDEQVVGFALYYTSYSTWKGRCLYLEDFYVTDEHRNKGIGSALFDEVVEIARQRKVNRMDWQVLDWNVDALRFYRRKKALLDPEWINGRIFF